MCVRIDPGSASRSGEVRRLPLCRGAFRLNRVRYCRARKRCGRSERAGASFAPSSLHAVSTHPLAFVADDDESSLGLLAAWLTELGYEVHIARDGVELLERLEEIETTGELAKAFLVVTDLDMPRQNGLSALAAIRERFAGARVLMVTAFGDARVHTQARSLGATAILDKPFTMGRFTSTVAETLRDMPDSRRPSALARDGRVPAP